MLIVQMPLEERFVVRGTIQAVSLDLVQAARSTAEKIVANHAGKGL
jgi:hypothetical protein